MHGGQADKSFSFSHWLPESGSQQVTQAELELALLLSLPLECWDDKMVPPCPSSERLCRTVVENDRQMVLSPKA